MSPFTLIYRMTGERPVYKKIDPVTPSTHMDQNEDDGISVKE